MFYQKNITWLAKIFNYGVYSGMKNLLPISRPNIKTLIYNNKWRYNIAKDGKYAGYMRAHPDFIEDNNIYYPRIKNYFSFYIKHLFIENEFRNQGLGRILLNIAKKESFRYDCDGKVHVVAGRLCGEEKLPHKFYRKNGFDSQYKTDIKLIDNAIKNNTEVPVKLGSGIPMFLKTYF